MVPPRSSVALLEHGIGRGGSEGLGGQRALSRSSRRPLKLGHGEWCRGLSFSLRQLAVLFGWLAVPGVNLQERVPQGISSQGRSPEAPPSLQPSKSRWRVRDAGAAGNGVLSAAHGSPRLQTGTIAGLNGDDSNYAFQPRYSATFLLLGHDRHLFTGYGAFWSYGRSGRSKFSQDLRHDI